MKLIASLVLVCLVVGEVAQALRLQRLTRPATPATPATKATITGELYLDGQILRESLSSGEAVEAGFSTNQNVSPDGTEYPFEEVAKAEPQSSDMSRGMAMRLYNDSHPDDDLDLSPSDGGRSERSLVPGQCPRWRYWIKPWWVYAGNIWWPVLNSNWWGWQWHHWWYCLPNRSCRNRIQLCPSSNNYITVCSRCVTEWGWIRVPVWNFRLFRPWGLWIRAPVGCCCNAAKQWLC